MHPHVRHLLTQQTHQPQILHDDGIHTLDPGPVNHVQGATHLVCEYHDVGRQIDSGPSHMCETGHLGQTVQREVLRSPPGVELLHTEIHRIGAVVDGCTQRSGTSCGSKQFGDVGRNRRMV
jgi:hypothetical protein